MSVIDWNRKRAERGLKPAPPHILEEQMTRIVYAMVDLEEELKALRRDYSYLIQRIKELAQCKR